MTLLSGPIAPGAPKPILLGIGGVIVLSVASVTLAPRLVANRQAPGPGETFRDPCAGCPELVVIPAGQFMMGSPSRGPWAHGPRVIRSRSGQR